MKTLVDLKSRARRTIVVQLPMSMASPSHPASKMVVRRSRQVKFQADPVAVNVERAMPPVVTIRPGDVVTLPKEALKLDPIAAAMHPSRRELIVLREHKPERKSSSPTQTSTARVRSRGRK